MAVDQAIFGWLKYIRLYQIVFINDKSGYCVCNITEIVSVSFMFDR